MMFKTRSTSEAYSEPCQSSNIELLVVNFLHKKLHLRCLTGPEYAS